MKRWSLLFAMVALIGVACAKSPMQPKPRVDPYAIFLIVNTHDTTEGMGGTSTARYEVSFVFDSSSAPSTIGEVLPGQIACLAPSGFVGQFTGHYRAIHDQEDTTHNPPTLDTLAVINSASFDPLLSPYPGWGDVASRAVFWTWTFADSGIFLHADTIPPDPRALTCYQS